MQQNLIKIDYQAKFQVKLILRTGCIKKDSEKNQLLIQIVVYKVCKKNYVDSFPQFFRIRRFIDFRAAAIST